MQSAPSCWPAGLTVLLVNLMCPCGTPARGGEKHDHYWVSRDPAIGYALPIQRVYQFPAAWVYQPTAPYGYTVPIQRVYQFPAAWVYQPGPEPWFGGVSHSAYDQYAGPSSIPR